MMNTKVNISENSKVKIKWKTLPMDYTKEREKDIISQFSSKYNIPSKNITLEVQCISNKNDNETEISASEIVSNINEPSFQHQLFKKFLIEREISDCDFDLILSYDEIINNKIDYSSYEKGKRYLVKWIKWDNFMSYGENNFFDFTNLQGLVLLNSEPANQAGKSTFCLDLLRFLLFGKVTSREDDWVLARLFNDNLPEATKVVVEGCVSINGQDYIIKRTVSRPELKKRTPKSKVSQKVEYYKFVNDNYVELTDVDVERQEGVSVTETNKIIKEAIGNENDFDLMICVNSDNLKKLISLKDTERGRLISRWVGLLPLEEKDKLAREYYNKTVLPNLLSSKYDIVSLEEEIKKLSVTNDDLVSTNDTLNAKIVESTKKLNDFNVEKENILSSFQQINDNLQHINIVTLKTEIDNLKDKGTRKRQEMNIKIDELNNTQKIDFDENEYQKVLAKDKELAISLNNALNKCNQIKNEIDTLKRNEFCPTCHQKLQNVNNTQAINDKTKELDEIIKNGKILRNQVNEITQIKQQMEINKQIFNDRNKLELLVATMNLELNNLINDYREKTQILADVERNKEFIEKNNNLTTSLNIVKANIQNEETQLETFKKNIVENNTVIDVNKNNIMKLQELIETCKKENDIIRHWKIYLELVGKNGISKMVLKDALPIINTELKRLLNDVCNFDVEVIIDDHNDVAFNMIKDGATRKLSAGSGFEQTVSSLALRNVLGKISNFSKPSFIVFDEVLGGVADENYDNLKHLYDKIVVDNHLILQITHLKQIFDWHDSCITIVNENNISKIKSM